MTTIELKTRVYQQIAHFDEAQLEKLRELLDKKFVFKTGEPLQKRVGGKHKGQFIIHDEFDRMPDEFMAAFTNG